jgi:hypothetical protein
VQKIANTLYRASTLKQVNRENGKDDIPMQRQACREFAARQGWQIGREFEEKGVSGYKVSAQNRDAIQDLKEAAQRGEFHILLVFMFDRIGRIDDETPFVVEWFVRHGIEVWSVKEGEQRFDSHVDKLTNYIRFWQASGESEKTSMRTKTRLNKDLLSKLYEQAQADVAAAAQAVQSIETALQTGEQQRAALEQQFDDMQSWVALYDRCDMATKKMIVSRILSAVRVRRDYEVEIALTLGCEQLGLSLDAQALAA